MVPKLALTCLSNIKTDKIIIIIINIVIFVPVVALYTTWYSFIHVC